MVPGGTFRFLGGDDGIRTHDPLLAGQVLSQLSYTPIFQWLLVLFFSTVFFLEARERIAPFSAPMSALNYLPVRLPAKYFRHCRA